MRAVVQRVQYARVRVDGEIVGQIGPGYLVLAGSEAGDTEADEKYLVEKVAGLRVFEDGEGKMNLSILDAGGAILLVSQFTLLGDARHGRRPSFSSAERPEKAEPALARVAQALRARGLTVETGRFQTHMEVELLNDGPVTILLDSRKGF